VRLLMSVADNRGDDAADVLIEIGDELPGFDRQAYTREIAALLARQYDVAVAEVETGAVLYEVINISFRQGIRLPAELTLLAKALFNLDAVTRRIDPSFSPIDTIREYGQKISAERARRDLHPRHLVKLLGESADLAMALPHRLDLITQRMANNELEFRHDVPQLARMMEAMQKVANRVFSGLVLAGLLVSSAMLMPHRRSLGTAGFVLAGAIGVWMVLTILWSDRKRRGD
jgi:ubiquinone biosynthesis protein